jgi:excinuclease ABC subunit A
VHEPPARLPDCGRGFKPLEPRQFSFNSPLGWCPSCDGLGTRTGVDRMGARPRPDAHARRGRARPLAELDGPQGRRIAAAMLEALGAATGLPIDVPLADLSGLQQRVLFEGTGEKWIDVPRPPPRKPRARPWFRALPQRKGPGPWFSFQFKGLENACEEAARLVVGLRGKVDAVMGEVPCSECGGSRLADVASRRHALGPHARRLVPDAAGPAEAGARRRDARRPERKIAGDLLRELNSRVSFLVDVGLDYLDMARPAGSLSGGELQRIRLAAQVGSGLTGVLYVLDEPTIGLHPRDTHRLITALGKLRDLGNTVVVVEHDRDVVAAADTPSTSARGAAARGKDRRPSRAQAKLATLPERDRAVSQERSGLRCGAGRKERDGRREPTGWLEIRGIRHRTLKGLDARIPLGVLAAVTGPSGSGKTSLVLEVLWRALARRLHAAREQPGNHDSKGLDRSTR